MAELRACPLASLHTVEAHQIGLMIRACTTRFMERVAAGQIAAKSALRSDRPAC